MATNPFCALTSMMRDCPCEMFCLVSYKSYPNHKIHLWNPSITMIMMVPTHFIDSFVFFFWLNSLTLLLLVSLLDLRPLTLNLKTMSVNSRFWDSCVFTPFQMKNSNRPSLHLTHWVWISVDDLKYWWSHII